MSRKVFEYFYEPEELEPFYSELLKKTPTKQEVKARPRRRRVVSELQPQSIRAVQRETLDSNHKDVQPVVSSRREESVVDEVERESVVVEQTATKAEPDFPPEKAASSQTRVRQILSVHALGQLLYCPLSAILAAELGDQSEPKEDFPRLTYLPCFDRERIEEMLKTQIQWLTWAFLLTLGSLGLAVFAVVQQYPLLFLVAVVGIFGFAALFFALPISIAQLVWRRRAAKKAEATEPDPEVTEIQPVNWWSMLKCGYEPANYLQPFLHPELPLEGCPWRVLERGSRRIPVIRSGATSLGFEKGELYPKHEIRLVAYALLLESISNVEVPFGLVFPAQSPVGLALPITDELRNRATAYLMELDKKLKDSQQNNMDPRPPENRNLCKDCQYGAPEQIAIAEVETQRKAGNRLLVLEDSKGQMYHCKCGDRFGAAPPHARSEKLGLTSPLQ